MNAEIESQNVRISELEYTLEQLKSQLLDTHEEDSVIITIINNALNKENIDMQNIEHHFKLTYQSN